MLRRERNTVALRYTRASLSGRYVTFFIFLLVVPVFLSGIVLDRIYFSRLRAATVLQLQDSVDQLAESIDTEIRQIHILSAALINDPAFLESCRSFAVSMDTREAYRFRLQIDRHLAGFFNYTNKIGTVYLFFRSRELYYYQNYRHNRPVRSLDRSILTPAIEQPLLNHVVPQMSGVNPVDLERPTLSIVVSPDRDLHQAGFEAMMVSFRIALLDQIDQSRGPATLGATHIVDDNGRVILSSDASNAAPVAVVSSHAGIERVIRYRNGSPMLVSRAHVPSTGWELVRTIDYQRFVRPLRRIRWVTYGVFIALSAAFIVYTWLFFHDLVAPLHAIVHQMRTVETGAYSVRVTPKGPREIVQLGRAFNRMLNQIQSLTLESQAREREKNRYEMEALQYRIQPHFVANTLNSIRLMAETEGNRNIATMAAALMRVVTESFNQSGRYSTLDDEIRSIESYVHIMKVRFGELIDVDYEIEEQTRNLVLLKMLLQPIVENAILHGIRPVERPGQIAIIACTVADSLVITVRDNGVGMDAATIARLFDAPAQSSERGLTRVGVCNVHYRIKLNYGAAYGIAITSTPNEGTAVTLTLPTRSSDDA